MIVQVTGPDWCAGFIADGGRVTDAAPKLRWAIGKDTVWLARYFAKKGWKAEALNFGKKDPAVCLDSPAGPQQEG